MPHYAYVTTISSSVDVITVMISKECYSYVPGCDPHGRTLTALPNRLYPRASVGFLLE